MTARGADGRFVSPGDAPSAKPVPKVTAAGGSGAVVLVLVWLAGLFGLDVPAEVAAALAALAAFAGGYLKRDTSRGAGGDA